MIQFIAINSIIRKKSQSTLNKILSISMLSALILFCYLAFSISIDVKGVHLFDMIGVAYAADQIDANGGANALSSRGGNEKDREMYIAGEMIKQIQYKISSLGNSEFNSGVLDANGIIEGIKDMDFSQAGKDPKKILFGILLALMPLVMQVMGLMSKSDSTDKAVEDKKNKLKLDYMDLSFKLPKKDAKLKGSADDTDEMDSDTDTDDEDSPDDELVIKGKGHGKRKQKGRSIGKAHGCDPLILDTNKDGKISAFANMGVDIDGDGIADGAAIGGDKMLAMGDINGDGKITGIEVFGNKTIDPFTGKVIHAANGFQALKAVALSAQKFTPIKNIIDANGQVDVNRLKQALKISGKGSLGMISGNNTSHLESLSDISKINTTYVEQLDYGNVQHRQIGSYTDGRGQIQKAEDIWFVNN